MHEALDEGLSGAVKDNDEVPAGVAAVEDRPQERQAEEEE